MKITKRNLIKLIKENSNNFKTINEQTFTPQQLVQFRQIVKNVTKLSGRPLENLMYCFNMLIRYATDVPFSDSKVDKIEKFMRSQMGYTNVRLLKYPDVDETTEN